MSKETIVPEVPIISRSVFVTQLLNSIEEDWRNIILESSELRNSLVCIIETLYQKYEPRPGGAWNAAPMWTEIFQWTSCPFHDIRAILVDKEPLGPNVFSYRSTGYALGVRRRVPYGVPATVQGMPTIWNFLGLAHRVANLAWTQDVQNAVEDAYRTAFNPDYLSRHRHFLFLRLALTKGPCTDGTSGSLDFYDLDLWKEFVYMLLQEIEYRSKAAIGSEPIPMVLLYNKDWLQYFLDAPDRRFDAFRPKFMDRDALVRVPHISVFTQVGFDAMTDYVESINLPRYVTHRQVWSEIAQVMSETTELL